MHHKVPSSLQSQCYLVGGAVRDHIMSNPVSDQDYVIVGSTPEIMLSLGFSQVGADFPVFLHPETGEEYALARTERSTGKGYLDFETSFTNVSLEDDLKRRDLTINAIAMSLSGDIIDPFHGMEDIKNKILRHTSDAFQEDPLRILRLARFAARFNFTIAPETCDLCDKMIKEGALNALVAERVQLELKKTFNGKNSSAFFRTLQDLGALKILFPEIHSLIGQTQPVRHHAEGDAFEHTMMVLDETEGYSFEDRLSALCHDFGKGITPKNELPHHYNHEKAGVPITKAFCDRLRIPTQTTKLAMRITEFHGMVHRCDELSAKTIISIYEKAGGKNEFHHLESLCRIAEADHKGRISENKEVYIQASDFMQYMTALKNVQLRDIVSDEKIKSMNIDRIKQTLHMTRVDAIKNVKNIIFTVREKFENNDSVMKPT